MPAEQKSEFVARFWTNPMSFRLVSCGTLNDLQLIKCTRCWKPLERHFDWAMSSIKCRTVDGHTWTHTSSSVSFLTTESITQRSSFTPNSRFGCILMTPMYKRSVVVFSISSLPGFKNVLFKYFRLAQILKPLSTSVVAVVTSHCFYCTLFRNINKPLRMAISLTLRLTTLHHQTGGRSHQVPRRQRLVLHVVPLRPHQTVQTANIRT